MGKIDLHAAWGSQAAPGRILMCGLVFCMLLLAIPAGVAGEVVTFQDTGLEDAVRDALDKSRGDITDEDMAALSVLDADDSDIDDLSGLQAAVNLRGLDLDGNKISDLGPLANLTNLRDLDLDGNEISDINPLVNLTNLRDLDLDGNEISDISPLSNLTNLRDLDLDGNRISDLGPLANLTNLRDLDLDGNEISDISPLSNLTNLRDIDLDHNEIRDLGPLAAGSAFGSGDSLEVRYNFLNLTPGSDAMRDIDALEERGVDISYIPQRG